MSGVPANPRNGEGDRPPEPKAEADGGGGSALNWRKQPKVLSSPIKLVKRARKLRKEMGLAEVLLWRELQKRPSGYKFRKQFPQIVSVDFACLSARLAIEVDGESHDRGDQPAFDAERDAWLREAGFRALRIPAREVLGNMEGVIQHIVAACGEVGPLHHRPAAGGPPPRSGEDLA